MGNIFLLCVLFVIIFWYSADKSTVQINDTTLSRLSLLLIILFIYNNINILFLFLILLVFIHFKGSNEFKQNIGSKIQNILNSNPKEIFSSIISTIFDFMKSSTQTIDLESTAGKIKAYLGHTDYVEIDSDDKTEKSEHFKVKKETNTIPDKYMNKKNEDDLLDLIQNFEIDASALEKISSTSTFSNDKDMKMLNELKKTNMELLETHEDFIHGITNDKKNKINKLKKKFDSLSRSMNHK